ncbi:alpha/beta hydrolase-fold protein [Pseudoalteromonas rubra]|nr:alpha/beta hydrolase-fold protein [Pseudoalteromonas rubra]
MRILLIAILLGLFSQSHAATAVSLAPLVSGQTLTIESDILNEKREVTIYLPKNYNAQTRYHTLYILDAEHYFEQAIGVISALRNTRKIPNVILIGVKTKIRVRDYLPPLQGPAQGRMQSHITKHFPEFGSAPRFAQFLEDELIPWVERNYTVHPTRTLVGHSNAGVFGMHLLFNQPALFANYLLASPAPWWSRAQISQLVAQFKNSGSTRHANLFLTLGEQESQGYYAYMMNLSAQLHSHTPAGLRWQFKIMPGEDHSSIVFPSMLSGLPFLYQELIYPDLEETAKYGEIANIQTYFDTLSKRDATLYLAPQSTLADLAHMQFEYDRNTQAMATLNYFTTLYPESAYAHQSLGLGHMKMAQYSQAIVSFNTALSLLDANHIEDQTVSDFLNEMVTTATKKLSL